MRKVTIAAATTVLMFHPIAFAQQSGTAQEARAMLDKAIAALKADRDVALSMFNKGEGGFKDLATSMHSASGSRMDGALPIRSRFRLERI
jgi:hypothetical protein